jgi:hypothetical protein
MKATKDAIRHIDPRIDKTGQWLTGLSVLDISAFPLLGWSLSWEVLRFRRSGGEWRPSVFRTRPHLGAGLDEATDIHDPRPRIDMCRASRRSRFDSLLPVQGRDECYKPTRRG